MKKSEDKLDEKELKSLANLNTLEDLFMIVERLGETELENLRGHYKERQETENKKTVAGELVKKAKSIKELTSLLKKSMIDSLKEEYTLIKEKVRNERRGGKDNSLEEIELMRIPLKIRLFEATFGKKEYYAIKRVMHEVESSLGNTTESKSS